MEATGKNIYKIVCLLIILTVAAIRIHLANVPFERDEGEYAYAGQLLLKGVPPYQEVYNMKFPGVYFMYALSFKMFGENVMAPRYLVLILQLIGAGFIFFLAKRVVNPMAGWVCSAFFMLFNLTLAFQGTQTNTEHFVVAFLVPSLYFLYRGMEEESISDLLLSGLLLSTACLMKQHTSIFALLAVTWIFLTRRVKGFKYLLIYVIGGIIPLALMFFYLWHAGVWTRFYFLTVQYARAYIGVVQVQAGVNTINTSKYNSSMLSPILVWFAIVGLLGLLLPKYGSWQRVFILLLFVASALAVCPGFYFRRHYFIMTLPLFSLLFANTVFLLTGYFNGQRRYLILSLFVVANALFFIFYDYHSFFIQTPEQISEEMYPGSPFAISSRVASFIQSHSKPGDRICMVGAEPQLFFLSQRRSASGYIYIYPLLENQKYNTIMTDEFIAQSESRKPAILVYTSVSIFDPNYTQHDRLLNWFNNFKSNYKLIAISTAKGTGEAPLSELDTIAPVDTFGLRVPQVRVYERVEKQPAPSVP